VHSGPEGERHEFNTISNDRDFWETYMPHYITSIKEANVQSVMCAYSRLNGESCCGSDYLLNELLREQLGFDGYVVSDCGSVTDIYDGHHLVDSFTEAAVLALKSGVDLNCGRAMTFPFDKLSNAVNKGMLDESVVDTAAYRLMLARLKLGMFDPPEMVPYSSLPVEAIDSDKNKSIAFQMARESIVLLKNENNLLPLSKDIKTIAVIGPNADDHEVLYGNYHGTPSNPVSILEGMEEKLPNTEVLYSKGSELIDDEEFVTPVPLKFLLTPNNEQGLLASYYPNRNFSGKPLHSRIEKQIIIFDEFGAPFEDLEINNFSIRWEGFISFPETALYKLNALAAPHYQIFINDKLVVGESTEGENTLFKANKNYKIRIEFISDEEGFYFILVHSLDNSSLLKNALKIAEDADAIILAVGISSLIEEESLDRDQIELPEIQQSLIKEILKLNKPTVLVVLGGGAIAFDDEVLNVPAMVEAWYPGQSGGTAVADVLFGDYNPAGRLPVTFYKSTSQLPPFEDYSMDNRTYKYFKDKPLFSFGYGLSYASFAYRNFEIPVSINSGENIQITVDVENTGNVEGEEVVQVYVKDLEATVRVPAHSLQAFKRIHLKPGDKQTITFNLPPKQLALLNEDMNWMVEPGEFIISVGGGQPDYIPTTTEVLSETVQVIGNNYIVSE
ncbi:MAG: glycoside hydrolase family 3 C-terminal domain-containing protein, partial [Ignavibacteriaceae bacterium]